MTQISCKISDLEEICNLTSLKGKDPRGKEFSAMPDFLMNAEGEGIRIKAVDSKGVIGLDLSYKLKVESPGIIPIGDVENFQGYLGRYGSADSVTLSTTENRIILTRASPQKTAYIPMASVDTLTTQKNAEQILKNFQFNEKGYPQSNKTKLNLRLTLDAGEIKKVVDDGEVVKQRIYPWKVEGGVLAVKVGTEQLGQIETIITPSKLESDEEVKVSKTAFAYGVDNIFNNLSGEVEVYLTNGGSVCPMVLSKKTEKYRAVILLAPASSEE